MNLLQVTLHSKKPLKLCHGVSGREWDLGSTTTDFVDAFVSRVLFTLEWQYECEPAEMNTDWKSFVSLRQKKCTFLLPLLGDETLPGLPTFQTCFHNPVARKKAGIPSGTMLR
jgi:hypothetical protein